MQQPPPPPPSAPPPAQSPVLGQPQPGWTSPPGVSPQRWWFWACGGCAALALVAIAVFAFVVIRIFSGSPLRHFPTEASATMIQDQFKSVNTASSETLVITDPHSLRQVESYYQQALHQNGWTTDTRDPGRAASGDTWTIGRTESPSQSGTITFTSAGVNTIIHVDYRY